MGKSMRDEGSWKGFLEEVSLKKRSVGSLQTEGKGKKRVTLAKAGVKRFYVFKGTASSLAEVELTVN